MEEIQSGFHQVDSTKEPDDATGRLLSNMLGTIAQFETEIRAERQRKQKREGANWAQRGSQLMHNMTRCKPSKQMGR
ncbi:MAG: recombinase family protein [Anaerolineales bacterium]|nr:recombinase family protein [Anaerolineales bacterium]